MGYWATGYVLSGLQCSSVIFVDTEPDWKLLLQSTPSLQLLFSPQTLTPSSSGLPTVPTVLCTLTTTSLLTEYRLTHQPSHSLHRPANLLHLSLSTPNQSFICCAHLTSTRLLFLDRFALSPVSECCFKSPPSLTSSLHYTLSKQCHRSSASFAAMALPNPKRQSPQDP